MRLGTEEKQSFAARCHAGESEAEICADTGIARSTIYTWIKLFTVATSDSGYAVSRQGFMKMKWKIRRPVLCGPIAGGVFLRLRVSVFVSILDENSG